MRPQAFAQLWSLAEELATTTPMGRAYGPASTFDATAIGLILEPDEHRQEYEVTPLNADTFARTGCDGTHFSLLRMADLSPECWPVVMTVPMNLGGPWNYVVGENILDVLSLGCATGYSWLDALAYSPEKVVSVLEHGSRDGLEEGDRRPLALIRDRLNIRPWSSGVRSRLDDLHHRFSPHIRLSEEAME